jgi:mycothiol synthase
MNLRFEPLSVESLRAFHDLYRIVEIHDQIPLVTPWEEIEELIDDPYFDLATDGRLAFSGDNLVGYATVHLNPGSESLARAFCMGGVHPDYRRQGIGTALLEWEIGRAQEKLRLEESAERVVRTHAFIHEQDAIDLYEKNGFKPVRYFTELIRPLSPEDETPSLPGIEIVPWSDDRSEEVRLLVNLAFRDHWGSTPRDQAAWEHQRKGVGFRPDLSFDAIADGQVVASSLNLHFPVDQELTGRLEGWIGTLGTHPDYRKRGIASALINHSLVAFREAGFDHAMIGVDSESQTGANRLYEGLGFTPLHRLVQHQLS